MTTDPTPHPGEDSLVRDMRARIAELLPPTEWIEERLAQHPFGGEQNYLELARDIWQILNEEHEQWTDPATGVRYDLSQPLLDTDGDYWHHFGQLDLDDGPMPLMLWSGTAVRADVSKSFADLALLRDVIAEHGPLATVNGTA